MTRLIAVGEPDPRRTLLMGGAPLDILLAGEDTGGSFSLTLGRVRPGGGPPPHVHSREEEFFYLVNGALHATAGSSTFRASPGDLLCLPRGIAHGFRNPSAESDATMVGLFAPGGGERLLVESSPLANPAPGTTPPATGPDHLARVSRKFGVELVRPATDLAEHTLSYSRGRSPILVPSGAGVTYRLGTFTVTVKAGVEDTAGTYSVFHVHAAPHSQLRGLCSDVYEIAAYVLDGALHASDRTGVLAGPEESGTATAGPDDIDTGHFAMTGQALNLPRGTPATLTAGAQGVTALLVCAPAGLEQVLATVTAQHRDPLQLLAEDGPLLGLTLEP